MQIWLLSGGLNQVHDEAKVALGVVSEGHPKSVRKDLDPARAPGLEVGGGLRPKRDIAGESREGGIGTQKPPVQAWCRVRPGARRGAVGVPGVFLEVERAIAVAILRSELMWMRSFVRSTMAQK